MPTILQMALANDLAMPTILQMARVTRVVCVRSVCCEVASGCPHSSTDHGATAHPNMG